MTNNTLCSIEKKQEQCFLNVSKDYVIKVFEINVKFPQTVGIKHSIISLIWFQFLHPPKSKNKK